MRQKSLVRSADRPVFPSNGRELTGGDAARRSEIVSSRRHGTRRKSDAWTAGCMPAVCHALSVVSAYGYVGTSGQQGEPGRSFFPVRHRPLRFKLCRQSRRVGSSASDDDLSTPHPGCATADRDEQACWSDLGSQSGPRDSDGRQGHGERPLRPAKLRGVSRQRSMNCAAGVCGPCTIANVSTSKHSRREAEMPDLCAGTIYLKAGRRSSTKTLCQVRKQSSAHKTPSWF